MCIVHVCTREGSLNDRRRPPLPFPPAEKSPPDPPLSVFTRAGDATSAVSAGLCVCVLALVSVCSFKELCIRLSPAAAAAGSSQSLYFIIWVLDSDVSLIFERGDAEALEQIKESLLAVVHAALQSTGRGNHIKATCSL